MLSNDSRGTLMSYTEHSVQRRLKSNAPIAYYSIAYMLIFNTGDLIHCITVKHTLPVLGSN